MNQRPFDSVCELAADPGLIGHALRRLPEWMRREADRWPDPWRFLLPVPDMPKGFRQLFSAAQSQRKALHRIAEITRRAGSIDTSWGRKMIVATEAGDWKTARHAQDKVFASFWRYDRAKRLLDSAKRISPAMEAEVRKRAYDLHLKACRKLGRAKADTEDRPAVFEPVTMTEKIAWELVCGWLRNQNGAPGYCFFSDDALLDVFRVRLKSPELPFETVRKTRRSLGLKKATIFIYAAENKTTGFWELRDRHGEAIC